MAVESLPSVPNASDIFIDANIFIYGLSGQSAQCRRLLERCSREEVIGITLFEIVNEATHQFMMAEAKSKGLIQHSANAKELRQKYSIIPGLIDYWHDTERILSLNLLFIGSNDSLLQQAQAERQNACLLTNDSMIVSCMREYGIRYLATRDTDFERVRDITIFRPDDLP